MIFTLDIFLKMLKVAHVWQHFRLLFEIHGRFFHKINPVTLFGDKQGDQIGRIFAQWVIVYLG
jgi:hypothetical protein